MNNVGVEDVRAAGDVDLEMETSITPTTESATAIMMDHEERVPSGFDNYRSV